MLPCEITFFNFAVTVIIIEAVLWNFKSDGTLLPLLSVGQYGVVFENFDTPCDTPSMYGDWGGRQEGFSGGAQAGAWLIGHNAGRGGGHVGLLKY